MVLLDHNPGQPFNEHKWYATAALDVSIISTIEELIQFVLFFKLSDQYNKEVIIIVQ